jgi:hypothetical protein
MSIHTSEVVVIEDLHGKLGVKVSKKINSIMDLVASAEYF